MATCKDCVHVDVCEDITRHKLSPSRAEKILPILRERGKTCELFKDRSRFVELPCDIISKAEIKRELSAQCAVKKIDVETAKDMLENLPYIRVNTKQELKEREENA